MPNTTKIKIKISKTIPYPLLLLADPSKKTVDKYINKCLVFTAFCENDSPCGVVALLPHDKKVIEIKNIAVAENHQNQGIGSQLIKFSIRKAKKSGYGRIEIGTGNSSFGQLYLYQKHGFRIDRIIKDFFVKNYSEKIMENNLECRDMIVLAKKL